MTHYSISSTPVAELKIHTAIVNGVALSRDGKKLATISADGTLKLTTLDDVPKTITLISSTSGIRFTDVIITADGSRVLSFAEDRRVRIQDINTGDMEYFPVLSSTPAFLPMHIILSPDETRFFTLGFCVTMYDFASRALLGCIQDKEFSIDVPVMLPVTPDGSRILLGKASGNVYYIDTTISPEASTGTILQKYLGHTDPISALELVSDGRHFISAGMHASVNLWDLETGACLRKISDPKLGVWNVVVLQDRATIICASRHRDMVVFKIQVDDTSLITYDMERMMTRDTPRANSLPPDAYTIPLSDEMGGSHSLALNANGTLLASGGSSGTVALWSVSAFSMKAARRRAPE